MSRLDVCGAADQENSTIWPKTMTFPRELPQCLPSSHRSEQNSPFAARSSNCLDLRHYRHLSDSRNTLPISPDSAGTFQVSRTGSPGTPLVDRESPGKSPETTQIDRKCVLEVDYLSVAPRIITLRPRGDLRRPLRRGLPGAHFRVKIGPVRVRRVLKTGRRWHPRCPQYPY